MDVFSFTGHRLPTDFEAKSMRQQYVGPCKTCLDRCAMLEQHSLSFGYVHDNFLHYMTKRNRCRLLNQNIQSKGKSRARFYSPVLQVGLTFLFCDAIMQAIRGLKGISICKGAFSARAICCWDYSIVGKRPLILGCLVRQVINQYHISATGCTDVWRCGSNLVS